MSLLFSEFVATKFNKYGMPLLFNECHIDENVMPFSYLQDNYYAGTERIVLLVNNEKNEQAV